MRHRISQIKFIVSLWIALSSLIPCLAGTTEDVMSLYKAGNYKAAREVLDKSATSVEKNPNLLYYSALTYHQLGESANAVKTYNQILVNFPNSGAAIYARKALGLPAKKSVKSVSTVSPSPNTSSDDQNIAEPELAMFVLYPGTKIVNHYTYKEEGFHLKCVAAFSLDPYDKVISYYKEQFQTKGWQFVSEKPVASHPNAQGTQIIYNKGSEVLEAVIEHLGGQTSVRLSVCPMSEYKQH